MHAYPVRQPHAAGQSRTSQLPYWAEHRTGQESGAIPRMVNTGRRWALHPTALPWVSRVLALRTNRKHGIDLCDHALGAIKVFSQAWWGGGGGGLGHSAGPDGVRVWSCSGSLILLLERCCWMYGQSGRAVVSGGAGLRLWMMVINR